MSNKIAEGTALGARYRIHSRTGTVDSTDSRVETEVTGNVSGGGGVGGYNAPVTGSVQSKTTRYQNIYLTDDDGKEHNISLVNFEVPCRQGQKLTMLFLTAGDKESGSYFRAYNHNTREHCNHPKGVVSEMFPWKIAAIVMGVIALFVLVSAFSGDNGFGEALFVSIIGLVIIGLIVGAIGWIFAYVRSIAVRSNPVLKSYLSSLGTT
jgi:hypothetical protein